MQLPLLLGFSAAWGAVTTNENTGNKKKKSNAGETLKAAYNVCLAHLISPRRKLWERSKRASLQMS